MTTFSSSFLGISDPLKKGGDLGSPTFSCNMNKAHCAQSEREREAGGGSEIDSSGSNGREFEVLRIQGAESWGERQSCHQNISVTTSVLMWAGSGDIQLGPQ